ncbi:hypothetical protein HPB50_020448 [Hyalomma asiaticum]|uniref:Uncharacterized protein n=1 Tax=Hyalomma asiaticum TaxID=266040 RepID=A0ACB7S4N4_HYAAI|nr:hypothetical protein HPB50_020448 [Hyalomma asiaticum]
MARETKGRERNNRARKQFPPETITRSKIRGTGFRRSPCRHRLLLASADRAEPPNSAMAKAPGGPVGDPLLVSTFALSSTKKRLMLYENGISIADVSRHSSEYGAGFVFP